MGKRNLGILSLLLAIIFILGACGGSNNSSDGGDNGSDNGEGNETQETTYEVGISLYVDHPSLNAAEEGFKKALEDAGLNVKYNKQNAQADPNTAKTIAQNLVNAGVDLIFANATPSAQAAVSETKSNPIPVVFTSVTDPVGAELIDSMESPGGNVTGTADMHPDAIPNTIKFIAEQMEAKTIGTIYNAGEQNSVKQIEVMKEAMDGTGLELEEKTVANTSEVKQAADSLVGKVDVIFIVTDNTVVNGLEAVISVAEDNDIPLFVGELDSVKRGGFAAYGFDYFDIGYEAGELAVKILKDGKDPSELPAQYPQNLKLVINKNAAKEMGIELKSEWDNMAEYIE
ncbi:ABC transporter substrate-binding protein [Fervidibacillus halotolerans]|uniref:ABC transporter substrate-binding protein n=1 Tax=Fervidibacillus halotolerans TaxID=2980027 RepID=A0A9E8M189_9BACI|nr:ABC transporter substrate-binding protein [Fervidibacillus halotolerans]WAA13025.1 ABC transporter substrate-binding protein [Fervidibacillus halotolerans]